MFGLWGGAAFFLLIPFPRFNNAHEARDLSRQFGALVPGFARFAYLLFYAPALSALSLDSAAATSSPLNYFSSPAQGRDQRSNPQSKFSAGPLSSPSRRRRRASSSRRCASPAGSESPPLPPTRIVIRGRVLLVQARGPSLGLIVVRARPSEALPYSVAVPGLVGGTPPGEPWYRLSLMYRTGFPVSVRFGVKWAESHILLRARPTSGAASQSLAAAIDAVPTLDVLNILVDI